MHMIMYVYLIMHFSWYNQNLEVWSCAYYVSSLSPTAFFYKMFIGFLFFSPVYSSASAGEGPVGGTEGYMSLSPLWCMLVWFDFS